MSALLCCLVQVAAMAAHGDGLIALQSAPQSAPQPVPVQVDPTYEDPLQRARALATSGDPAQREQALAIYAAMLERSPDNSDVLLARGRTYAWMGRYADAEADLRGVTARKPDYADAWSALGDMYSWSGRARDAAAAYGHWLKLQPDDPAAANALARADRAANAEAHRADVDPSPAATRDAGEDVPRLTPAPRRMATADAAVADGYQWSLRAGLAYSGFSGGRSDWNDADLSLRRKFDGGSLALEWLHADRFGSRDVAWALDGYASLWSRAYANARYQRSAGSGLYPRQAWRVEVFQGAGQGWELSASIDHLQFSSATEFYGVGVARYIGNWYARYKLQHVPGVGSGSWSHRAVVRNYYQGNADDYVEISAGSGRSDDLDRFGGVVRDSNASLGLAWVHYFRPQWGFKLGAGYASDAGGFDERSVSAALYRRW